MEEIKKSQSDSNFGEFSLKNLYFVLNLIFGLLVLIFDALYISYSLLIFKSIASILFVIIGAINLIYFVKNKSQNLKFSILLLVGLFFAMLGDIILNIHFISGAALFAIGHIFFFISYSALIKFKWKDLIYGICIFIPATLFITLAPIFDFGGILMEIVCIAYALIISLMVGKSISNIISSRSLLFVIILIGSLLFLFSDIMLLLNVFGGLPKIIDILCLVTYYPAEILLAFSIFVAAVKNRTN